VHVSRNGSAGGPLPAAGAAGAVIRRRQQSPALPHRSRTFIAPPQVNLGEEEPEDIAVRRFMKAVMDSKLLDKLRARRYTETKIEAYKRRLRERHEARK